MAGSSPSFRVQGKQMSYQIYFNVSLNSSLILLILSSFILVGFSYFT